MTLSSGKKEKTEKFPKTDQLGAELEYFAECIRRGKDPEPSGLEGYADVRVVSALYRSLRSGKAVKLKALVKRKRPVRAQEKRLPPVKKPRLVRAKPATRK